MRPGHNSPGSLQEGVAPYRLLYCRFMLQYESVYQRQAVLSVHLLLAATSFSGTARG
jgi:hypothetical protein